MEEVNYNLLPKQAWDLLVSRYGLSQGSRPIPRLFNFMFWLIRTLLFLLKLQDMWWIMEPM